MKRSDRLLAVALLGAVAILVAILITALLAQVFIGPAQAASPAAEVCPHAWDKTFRKSNRLFMPAPLRGHWRWHRDQAVVESGCRPRVCSQVGACGVLQIMPGTWEDLTRGARQTGSVFAPKMNIIVGVRYMAWQTRQWLGRPRSASELFALGAAGYNAGLGHVLKAQARCGGARTWPEIAPCLPAITGEHSRETIQYIERIEALR